VNSTPRFTALVSFADAVAGCVLGDHRLHGHWAPAVVKLHEYGLAIVAPELV
jgi:hypothetical protein